MAIILAGNQAPVPVRHAIGVMIEECTFSLKSRGPLAVAIFLQNIFIDYQVVK
jgi:hypothetical protein